MAASNSMATNVQESMLGIRAEGLSFCSLLIISIYSKSQCGRKRVTFWCAKGTKHPI